MASKDTRKTPVRGRNAALQKNAGAKSAADAGAAKPGAADADASAAKPVPKGTGRARGTAAKPAGKAPDKAEKTAPRPPAKVVSPPVEGSKTPARARTARKPAAATAPANAAPAQSGDVAATKPAKTLGAAANDLAREAARDQSAAAGTAKPTGARNPTSTQFAENMERIDSLTQRLASALSRRPRHDPGVEGPGADLMVNAGMAAAKLWAEQPSRILEQQVKYWGATFARFAELQSQLVKGKLTAPPDEQPETDRRFKNPLW